MTESSPPATAAAEHPHYEAEPADFVAALTANPQLRAAVLEGLGECMRWSIAEERMAAVITKLRLAESELAVEQARVRKLDARRRESRQLLHRLTKYVVEDRAATPGKTRLMRLTEQVKDYLNRTNEPADILRSFQQPAAPPFPATTAEVANVEPSTAARSGSVGGEAAAQSSGTTPPLVRARNCLGHAERDHQKWMQRYDGEQGTFEDSRFSWLLSAVDDIARHLEAQRPLTLADVDRRIAELARAAGDLAGIDHFASRRALERLQEAAEAGKP